MHALFYLGEFKIASKTDSNTKMANYTSSYQFVLPCISSSKNGSIDSAEQRVFVVTTYTLTLSVTEVLNY
jgi:hypothetical protein